MYKVLVHKGDYITYKLGERIVTEPVERVYIRHCGIDLLNSDIRDICRINGYIESQPINIQEALTFLNGVEIYNENNIILNDKTTFFKKCTLSNSDDIIWGRTDIDDEIDAIIAYIIGYNLRQVEQIRFPDDNTMLLSYKNNYINTDRVISDFTENCIGFNRYRQKNDRLNTRVIHSGYRQLNTTVSISSTVEDGFISTIRRILSIWVGKRNVNKINVHKSVPFGIFNARRIVQKAFIDGLSNYAYDMTGGRGQYNEFIFDLFLRAFGKEFIITYRMVLEQMLISYRVSVDLNDYGVSMDYFANSRFGNAYRNFASQEIQEVTLRRGNARTQQCYLIDVRNMIGVNGYKFIHK